MPSLWAYFLALGTLLCPLTWCMCSLSAQLRVGAMVGSEVQGGLQGWSGWCGWCGAVEGEGLWQLREHTSCLPCPPHCGQLIVPEVWLCQLSSLCLIPVNLRKVSQLIAVTLDVTGGREGRKENMFLTTKVCFHELELAVRWPSALWAITVGLKSNAVCGRGCKSYRQGGLQSRGRASNYCCQEPR